MSAQTEHAAAERSDADFAANVRAPAEAMRGLFPRTPLQQNAYLSARYGARIFLKREDLSPVRSYKIRGAFNFFRKRAGDGGLFVCASAGNHAQGFAYACRHFGKKGVVFMPVTTPQQKIHKTRTFGGTSVELRLVGDYFDETLAAAQAFCAEIGAHFLAPFDDPDVIEGQASVTVELLDQLGRMPDMVVLPVGGGGLSAGARRYLSEVAPEVALRLVEPAGGASLTAALATGAPVTLPRVDNFVDGASVARVGARTFDALSGTPEDRICTTLIEMLNIEGIVLEPAGALAVDVLPALADEIAGKTVICVTSGGNFDFERLPEVKERAQRYSGLKKYFILRLPQRPGALRDFLDLLGPADDIARFEYLKKSARNFGSVLIGIETENAANFTDLFARLDARGFAYQDITHTPMLAELLI